MKRFYILLLCLIVTTISAQNKNQCVHCNMIIKDKLHQAEIKTTQKTLYFDAIECLINYLKTKKETSFLSLKVTDFKSGNLIEATTATYLKSKAIPSPMGANLSAFKEKKEAEKLKNTKGGELFNWKSINEQFKNSSFGALHHNHSRPDAHAPIGVMGDHLHAKGGFMVSLRYMHMTMQDNKRGTNTINDAEVYNDFMVAPQKMSMDMYMLGIMYAPSDKITLMLMQNFLKNNMSLTARMMMGGMPMLRDFTTATSGIGDMRLASLINIYNTYKSSLHINTGIQIPLGNIENRGDTPMMANAKLPYAMQLGSGTLDLTLGGTFKQSFQNSSLGMQLLSTFRTGNNSQEYRFGNLHQFNFWGAYNITSMVSFSGRLLGVLQGKIKGMDSELNPMVVTTANIHNYGGEMTRGFLGFNVNFPETSSFQNLKLGAEVGASIHENYNGIQMDEGLNLQIGIKYSL